MKREGGFTLLELLVSIALLGVLFVGGLGACLKMQEINRRAASYLDDVARARRALDEIGAAVRAAHTLPLEAGGLQAGPAVLIVSDGDGARAWRVERGRLRRAEVAKDGAVREVDLGNGYASLEVSREPSGLVRVALTLERRDAAAPLTPRIHAAFAPRVGP